MVHHGRHHHVYWSSSARRNVFLYKGRSLPRNFIPETFMFGGEIVRSMNDFEVKSFCWSDL